MYPAHSTPRVLLVIDDDTLRRRSEAGLRTAGFVVSAPTDAEAVAVLLDSFGPDVVVVATSLRDADGRPLHQRLCTSADHYVLCLAPADEGPARIQVLRAGADDVVSLPVNPDELVARCEALLRRPRRRDHARVDGPRTFEIGPLTVDLDRHEATLSGRPVSTTKIEFALLAHLCRAAGTVATRSELLDEVWGPGWVGDTHVVDVHLSNLRRKLEQADDSVKIVHTVRGVGFRLADDVMDHGRVNPHVASGHVASGHV